MTITFLNGLPNLTQEEKNSIHSTSLSYKLKEKPIKLSCVPAVGMMIMINSFYHSYKLDHEEGLIWDKSFETDENFSCEIHLIGIHKKNI